MPWISPDWTICFDLRRMKMNSSDEKAIQYAPKSKSLSVPDAMLPRYQEIVTLTDALCTEKLNA